MTEDEKIQAMRDHISRDHGAEPLTMDLAALTFSWHPAIHEFEDAKKKFHAIQHTIQVMEHVDTSPED